VIGGHEIVDVAHGKQVLSKSVGPAHAWLASIRCKYHYKDYNNLSRRFFKKFSKTKTPEHRGFCLDKYTAISSYEFYIKLN